MHLGYISPQHLPVFGSLLLPIAVEALEQGEPILAIGLTENRVACGATAGYINNGRFQIISFYVAPDYRRRGGGRMLMESLFTLLNPFPGVFDIDLHYTQTTPEHESLAPFLTKLGFVEKNTMGETLYRTTLGDVAASPFFATKLSSSSKILPFSQIPDICLSMTDKDLRLSDVPLPQLPLNSPEVERELSCAVVQGSNMEAFVSFDHSCMGELTLSCAWSGHASPTAMPTLLLHAFHRANQLYPPETPLVLQSVTPVATHLLQKLIPTAKPFSFTYSYPLNKGSH